MVPQESSSVWFLGVVPKEGSSVWFLMEVPQCSSSGGYYYTSVRSPLKPRPRRFDHTHLFSTLSFCKDLEKLVCKTMKAIIAGKNRLSVQRACTCARVDTSQIILYGHIARAEKFNK